MVEICRILGEWRKKEERGEKREQRLITSCVEHEKHDQKPVSDCLSSLSGVLPFPPFPPFIPDSPLYLIFLPFPSWLHTVVLIFKLLPFLQERSQNTRNYWERTKRMTTHVFRNKASLSITSVDLITNRWSLDTKEEMISYKTWQERGMRKRFCVLFLQFVVQTRY